MWLFARRSRKPSLAQSPPRDVEEELATFIADVLSARRSNGLNTFAGGDEESKAAERFFRESPYEALAAYLLKKAAAGKHSSKAIDDTRPHPSEPPPEPAVQPVTQNVAHQTDASPKERPAPTPTLLPSTADNIKPESQPMNLEQIVQASLKDAVESLAVKTSAALGPAADCLERVASPPSEPSPKTPSEPFLPPPVQPEVVKSEQSAETCEHPRKAQPTTPPSSAKRKPRAVRPGSPQASASPNSESQPSIQRFRVRRKLLWPENPEPGNQSE